uniref:4-hydroxybenzoate polyprenyltransferase n=1 Tax=Desulfatirhabdium butyrativorans TaxID=340467 RepID=A0A7C4VR56_9BACT
MRYVLSLLIVIAGWKALADRLQIAMLPAPEVVAIAFWAALRQIDFWVHVGASGFRACAALAASWLIGFPLGILIGCHPRIDRIASPMVFMTYPIPKIVFLPVVLVLFGLGDLSRVFVITLIVGYQILVSCRDCIVHLPRQYFVSIRSLGGGGWHTFRHVLVPAALPDGFTALRIGVGTAVAVLFFVESFATETGLGFLIMDAWGRFDGTAMFVAIAGMSLLGVSLYETVNLLEHGLCDWKRKEMKETTMPSPVLQSIQIYGRMIKFSHSIFAAPFALSALVLASRTAQIGFSRIFWIVVALVAARSAAMGFNRIVDARFDALNPRTATRELPAGTIRPGAAVAFVVLSALAFLFAAAMLSRLCAWLALPVLAVLFSYSYTKRFTAWSHVYLGFAISLAPLGAWIAATGNFDPRILALSLALLTYIAGFDILYACQDMDFDRNIGLFSLPARLGVRKAFQISSLLHVMTVLCLIALTALFHLGWPYLTSVAVIAVLLVIEHRLVKPDDLTHIDIAFFHINSVISVVLLVGVVLDRM